MEGEVSWCLLFLELAVPRGWLRQEGLRKHGLVLVPWDVATVLGVRHSGTCNPSSWEVEAGGSVLQGHPWLRSGTA